MIKKLGKNKILVVVIILLIVSNGLWFRLYQDQRGRVKNAIMPSLGNDYFSNQVSLTKYTQEVWEYGEGFLETGKYEVKKIKDVPLVNQNPKYPNGCEAASAVMLMQYYGIDITLDEFIAYLPKDKVYETDGTRYGPNPAKYYVGDPSSENKGWGCFDIVIANTMNKILKDKNIKAHIIVQNGKDPLEFLAQNVPCLIWVAINYEEVKEVFTWFSYDKKESYTYPKDEHVVVLTGYDENYYYINDPLKSEKNIKVSKEKLEKSYDSLGRQFVYIIPEYGEN